jgi:NADPH:quinone reductase-like Zn-dependent oxidoreductase
MLTVTTDIMCFSSLLFVTPCTREVQLPTPQKDEVRVKVHAVSLNPVDWKIPKYFHHLNFPRVVGLDVAGTIDSVGSDVMSVFLQ